MYYACIPQIVYNRIISMNKCYIIQNFYNFYHSKTFTSAIINYPIYENEFYALVLSVKKLKHYLMSKETIIQRDHHTLQYLQSQSKLQDS